MTLSEAARSLGLDPSTLRHQIANGKLRASRLGPIWTVRPSEVERYRADSLRRPGRPRRAEDPE